MGRGFSRDINKTLNTRALALKLCNNMPQAGRDIHTSVHAGFRPKPATRYANWVVQCGHRFAANGIGIAHCGQSRVVGAAAGAGFLPQRFTCCTSKNTANATIKKLMMAFKNNP